MVDMECPRGEDGSDGTAGRRDSAEAFHNAEAGGAGAGIGGVDAVAADELYSDQTNLCGDAGWPYSSRGFPRRQVYRRCFTIRSSSEWKLMTARRPFGASMEMAARVRVRADQARR